MMVHASEPQLSRYWETYVADNDPDYDDEDEYFDALE